MSGAPEYRPDLYEGTAEFYDRYRPGYPSALFDDLLDRATIGDRGRLLDLACGTGQIAFALADRFDEVIALDQEPEMVTFAAAKANALGITNVSWMVGPVESAVVDGAFTLITIGNAFHRLARQKVAERATSWLAPGGHLALLWSDSPWRGSAPWQQVVDETMREWARHAGATNRAPADWEAALDRDPTSDVLRRAGLRTVGRYEFPVDRTWSVEALLGFVYSTSTHSRVALGDHLAAFEETLRDRLLAVEPNGIFVDHGSSAYDLATFP